MRLLPRTPCGTILLAVLVGAAGVAALGFGLPPRPRLAWTPPEPAELVGFLHDGRTLLTLNHDPASLDPAGPLRRWDVAAGSETTIRLPGAGPMRYPLL